MPLPGLMLVEPVAAAETTPASELDLSPQRGATVVVGPEGGWTEAELGSFQQEGWISASLGDTILRAETAAIAAVALVTTHLSQQQ